MEEDSTGMQSRFLLRLAKKLAGKHPDLPVPWDRGWFDLNADQAEAVAKIGKIRWSRFKQARARFESELAYADSRLANEPPPSRVRMLLANSSELRQVAILQRYLEKAYLLRIYDPLEGLRIADHLIAWTESDPSSFVVPIRCRAFVERGNFFRILGSPEDAYAALEDAARELEARGITDPLDWARYLELLGALKGDCGDLAAARRFMSRALLRVRECGDNHSLQRVLIALGIVELARNNLKRAESLFDEAMRTDEPDSFLLTCAATNRLFIYFAGGEPDRAYRVLLRVRNNLGQSWLQVFSERGRTRQMWIEGQILSALGARDEAIGILTKSREFYIRSSLGFDACCISLDLAMNHAAQHRFADVRRELAFGLSFCSERSARDGYAKDAALLLQATLDRQGRIEANQVHAVSRQLDWIQNSPLQVFYQPPYSKLQL